MDPANQALVFLANHYPVLIAVAAAIYIAQSAMNLLKSVGAVLVWTGVACVAYACYAAYFGPAYALYAKDLEAFGSAITRASTSAFSNYNWIERYALSLVGRLIFW